MDEDQALLGKEFDNGKSEKCKSYAYQGRFSDDTRGCSSSDDSDEWWDGCHSSCESSCCSSNSESSFAWEGEINANGELFYIESDVRERTTLSSTEDNEESTSRDAGSKPSKIENEKKGKLSLWMRRRESKRQRTKMSACENPQEAHISASKTRKPASNEEIEGQKRILMKIDGFSVGETLSEKVLGIKTCASMQAQKVIIVGFVSNSVGANCKEMSIGDILRSVNEKEVTPQNLDAILRSLTFPSEIVLQLEMRAPSCPRRVENKKQSDLVRRITEKGDVLGSLLGDHSVGLVFVNLEKHTSDQKDIIYSFPPKSVLSSSRGSFITLYHLLSEIMSSSHCVSSSVVYKNQLSHVMYRAEDNYLMLIIVPDSRCTVKEATNIMNDLVRCLLFTHQTLNRCFTLCSPRDLDHFFSVFFNRTLSSDFSLDTTRCTSPDNTAFPTAEPHFTQFEDILPFAAWIPLPKEAQIQIDDALNELEANDFDYKEEENIENQRLYNIVGSCFFHKGYLLTSHLPKDDLLDVYSFCRQNCVIQLLRAESVNSIIIWREVFPLSVNRGLPSARTCEYTVPKGRWFLLIVGQGYDLLAVLLESGGCSKKAKGNPGPPIKFVEETEDTLKHIQKLGIPNLAAQWLKENVNCRTITPEEIFFNKSNRKKEHLLSFVKTLEGPPRVQAVIQSNANRSPEINLSLKNRNLHVGENSDDSISQATSNISEVSDENVPILGRRAERAKNTLTGQGSDSENSDSDWESFKEPNRYDLNNSGESSGNLRQFYCSDIRGIVPSKLTTGAENVLFHYVHLDSKEGILMCPTINLKSDTSKMKEILDKFRKSALTIHSLLENNVRFKKNSQDNANCFINKSLIAVKEHGILLECSTEHEVNKKTSFCYWVVGRLFFTPQPREIYVCYYDEAPQNLVEIAFRLGLHAAG